MNLGLLFLKRSDKQAWLRYAVMVIAIMLSMAALLSSIAVGNAMLKQDNRTGWRHQVIYKYSKDLASTPESLNPKNRQTLLKLDSTGFRAQSKNIIIEELGIRKISANSPLVPGLSRQPDLNEIFVSPALMELINTQPLLKERYTKYKISLGVPDNILASPDSKMLIYQMSNSKISNLKTENRDKTIAFGTKDLANFSTPPDTKRQRITNTFMLACGLGVCFPMLTLLISALRIGMVQREKRYAALSLIGASKKQVNQIILSEALVSTAFGIVLGIGLYELTRITVLANLRLADSRFFLNDITVAWQWYIYLILLVFFITILVNFVALNKVKSSPLGVVRVQKMPKRPSVLRLLPAVGAILATWKLNQLGTEWYMSNTGTSVYYLIGAFLLSMTSLVIAGPYLTFVFARIFSFFSRSMVGTIASKRLKTFSKTIFSSVSGVVLALFVGSFLFTTIASLEHTFSNKYHNAERFLSLDQGLYKNNVVEVGGREEDRQVLLTKIAEHDKLPQLISGQVAKKTVSATVPREQNNAKKPRSGELYTCAELKQFTIATCDKNAVDGDQVLLTRDYEQNNYKIRPYKLLADTQIMSSSILFRFNSGAEADVGREYLRNIAYELTRNFNLDLYVYQPATTIFDALEMISGLMSLIKLGTVMTILIAGLSVIISALGGIFERKKSFSNLKLLGIEDRDLFLVVLVESAIPMILASVFAVICGILVAKYLALITANGEILFALPHWSYLGFVTGALVLSVLLIFCTLPILRQVTSLEQNRTE